MPIDSITPADDATENTDAIKEFWESIQFFSNWPERFVARYWLLILSALAFAVIAAGVYVALRSRTSLSIDKATLLLRDPYVASLLVTLILSGVAFSVWQKNLRATFGDAVELGFIANNGVELKAYRTLLGQFEKNIRSGYRYLVIGAFVLFTFFVTVRDIKAILTHYDGNWIDFYLLAAAFCFPVMSYAAGAVAWSLFSAARWIASLSSSGLLRIQFGHSDECCGLKPIGTCCLQSTIPLIIGILLCLIWSNSNHIMYFKTYAAEWREIIVPAAFVMMTALFALACALVFLPIWPLHEKLRVCKAQRDKMHSTLLGSELDKIENALTCGDGATIKAVSERLSLLETLDPVKLKVSVWPFDRTGLIKYAAAPVASLVASFGKVVLVHLWR